ncbi:hypothetical protein [Nocardia sp. BMG51109]|uniref:hypothetical protein n=1 Tax=Nocardia sp. BMG51109 TaxID=1056816 RepID=UPI0004B112BC|nr:hypothetical protein [Nocardia sp. BMG51109]
MLRISKDISAVNDGETVSHAQLHNILTGKTENISEKTKRLLSRFFEKRPSHFCPPPAPSPPDADFINALATRIAGLDAGQIAAIKQIIDLVSTHEREEPP